MKAAFAMLLICACACAVQEVEDAAAHNAALAPSLLGAQNACNSPARMPGEENIFLVADARIVTLIPQAGGATSDSANASLLWSWSASFPRKARFSIRPDLRCPAGFAEYHSPSSPSFFGQLLYKYGNSTRAVNLSSHSENPVPLNLGREQLLPGDFSAPLANLSAFLSGSISVSYSFSKEWHAYSCRADNGFSWCSCEAYREKGSQTFTHHLQDTRNFLVENGPSEQVWLNPPLQSRLEGEETASLVLLARRMPSHISFSFAGSQIASSQPYSFSVHDGACGEKIVEREFSPSGSAFVNSSAPISPHQLVGENASYAPFYAQFAWRADAGKAEFETVMEDAFSRREPFLRNFSVRGARQQSPPSLQGAMLSLPAGDAGTASAFPSSPAMAQFPEFAALAAALAPMLAVGAIALLRRLGRG